MTLKCAIVTPERTEVDVTADAVTVPLFDGEMGILSGHSPLVGRLGYGVLKVRTGTAIDRYFVEGGFIQVANNSVSVLTDRVTPAAQITREVAEKAMKEAIELPTDKPDLVVVRDKAQARARAMLRIAASN